MLETAIYKINYDIAREPQEKEQSEYIHMKCVKVTALGQKKVPLCGCQPFVLMTRNKKRVTCPKCKQIIKVVTKKKRLGVQV